MAKTKELKNKIVEQLDGLDQDQLRKVLVLLKKLKPSDSQRERILAYAGIWKNLDNEVVDGLTTGLHERRSRFEI
jgi:hypothetical protein